MLEIEMKLAVPPQYADQVEKLKLLKPFNASKKTMHLLSEYYDTPNLDFMREGWALRIRKQDEQYIQTLKSWGEAVFGLHQREEWEWPLENAKIVTQPLLEHLPERLQSLVDNLQAIFTTEFTRTAWQVTMPEGFSAELAFDQGIIETGELEEPISEIEIELQDGEKKGLMTLASNIRAELPVKPFDQSKAERGYRLYQIWQANED